MSSKEPTSRHDKALGAGERPLVVAVPGLSTYHPDTGIGRVLSSLSTCWGERAQLVDARLVAPALPGLRNFPAGVAAPAGTDLVLFPRLTGARALCNTQEVPSLVIVHDVGVVDFPGDREGMTWLTRQAILSSFRGLRHASHIVAVSRFTRDRLLDYLPDIGTRVSVIPNVVAPAFAEYDRGQDEARRRVSLVANVPLGEPVLIYVGTETPRKNITLLLRVLRDVKARYPRAQLLKVGQAGDIRWRGRTLETARALGLRVGEDILILERVDDAILADAYRSANVFVSTSLYEGFGLPALEAMAVGTTVVVTRCGAFPEVVGDAGFVVDPRPECLVQAILAALADPQSEDSAIRGRARATALTLARSAEQYLEVMRETCGLIAVA